MREAAHITGPGAGASAPPPAAVCGQVWQHLFLGVVLEQNLALSPDGSIGFLRRLFLGGSFVTGCPLFWPG